MEFTVTFFEYALLSVKVTMPVWGFLLITILVLGQIAGRAEQLRPMTALYWSFVTATTVGYGDIRPSKPLARCLAVLIAITGLILFGIFVAIALSATTFAIEQHVDLSKFDKLED